MFYKIILSPQVKRWVIITYKHGRYELPHELQRLKTNDLRLKILQNYEISGKCPNAIDRQPSAEPPPPAKNESDANTKGKLAKTRAI